jgi:hypothetical protein
VTAEPRLVVRHRGAPVVDLPVADLVAAHRETFADGA